MSTEPQPAFTYKQIGITLLLIALAVVGYRAKIFYDQMAVESWVKETPVIQMVLSKHPRVYPRFIEHFTEPYKVSGEDGLREAQLEIQQIINVNYMTDYIWQIKDKQLKAYLKAQYGLIVTLLKNPDAVRARLCERYFADSSLFSEVDKAAGRDVFLAYMAASEDLFLSARDGVAWPITPKDPDYKVKVGYALLDLVEKYKKLYPKEAQAHFYKGFDPTQSCGRFATYLYVLLLIQDEKKQSLLWRSAMEYSRPMMEGLRKQRGSD